jgi:hypothetical protein
MFKFFYCFPFLYFWDTRLKNANISFHLFFEWIAALVLCVSLSSIGPMKAISFSVVSYFAFISVYEIGYICNDYISVKYEPDGRERLPTDVTIASVTLWVACRILLFVAISLFALRNFAGAYSWWSFYLLLSFVFLFHNLCIVRDLRVVSFQWLAWLRFMAPIIFVVPNIYVFGIGLAAALSYVNFRALGYLDSKDMLCMPRRRDDIFRLLFFSFPLLGSVALSHYSSFKGYFVLTSYFALISLVGVLLSAISKKHPQGTCEEASGK